MTGALDDLEAADRGSCLGRVAAIQFDHANNQKEELHQYR